MKLRSALLVLGLTSFVAFRAFPGCAAQGEGQLCNTLNNTNDDCAEGLTCQSIPGQGYMACCPPTGSTNPACMGAVTADGGTTTTTTGAGGSGGASGTGGMAGTGGSHPSDAGSDGDASSMEEGGMTEAGVGDAGDGGG